MLFIKKKKPKGVTSVDDAAKELGISKRTLWRRIEEHDIPTTPRGTYISDEDFKKLKEIQEEYKTGSEQ